MECLLSILTLITKIIKIKEMLKDKLLIVNIMEILMEWIMKDVKVILIIIVNIKRDLDFIKVEPVQFHE
jgi:hypothetical protein